MPFWSIRWNRRRVFFFLPPQPQTPTWAFRLLWWDRPLYHVNTELPVYLCLGDREDLLERWLGSAEVVNWLVMKGLFLHLASWTQIMLFTECPAKLRLVDWIGRWSWMERSRINTRARKCLMTRRFSLCRRPIFHPDLDPIVEYISL